MCLSNSTVVFSNNSADDGGAICCETGGCISFEENSSSVFSDNTADICGAIDGFISFNGNCSSIFSNNTANKGGAVCSGGVLSFKGNSTTEFSNNVATYNGGAVYIPFDGNISYEKLSTVVFRDNVAEHGGALFAQKQSDIIFTDNSTVKFINNKATFGATFFSNSSSNIRALQNCTIVFNGLSARWCNNRCLPYTGQSDVVTIDGNGRVWCSNWRSLICLSKKCYCNKLDLFLDIESNTLVNITDNMTLSSIIFLRKRLKRNNISIIGCNITVFCTDSGGLYFKYSNNLTIEGITWFRCGRSYGPVISIDPSYGVLIQNCNFENSVRQAISLSNVIEVANINHCNFVNNNDHIDHGAAILSKLSYDIAFIYISNCNFSYNGEAKSIVAFEYSYHLSFVHIYIYIYLNNSNFHNNQGVSVYLSRGCILHINGEVLFKNNMAENGAGIYISSHSTVIFDESTNSKFINNSVHYNGAAIFLKITPR